MGFGRAGTNFAGLQASNSGSGNGLMGGPAGIDASGVADEELKRLHREFMEIDKDGSGRIDKDEMNAFLLAKGIDEEHRYQIIDVVFNNCDIDGDQTIELKEFVSHYLNTKNMLVDRENDLLKSIQDSYKIVQESKRTLNLALKSQPQQMNGLTGILTITVLSA